MANVYRPFPKKTRPVGYNGESEWELVDREKLKEQYMSQPFYRWEDFCNAFNYDPNKERKKDFGVSQWQNDWLHERQVEQDEQVIQRGIKVREIVGHKRINYIEFWNNSYDPLQFLFQGTYNMYAAELREAYEKNNGDAKAALRHLKKTHRSWTGDIKQIFEAAQDLQKLQLTGLMMSQKDVEQLATKIRQRTAEEIAASADGERLHDMPMGITDAEGKLVKVEEAVKLMSGWYDQLEHVNPPENPEPPKPEPIHVQSEVVEEEEEDNPYA